MKKLLFILVTLFVCSGRADNIITSKEYVDNQANTLQTELPANNTNTVLVNTATAGEVGEKAIYDSNAAFGTQTDALVTVGAFNTAVQNALESEFVCIERQNGNGGCLLYEVRGVTPQHILPTDYTAVEYLQGNYSGTINTGVVFNSGTLKYSVEIKTESLVNESNNSDHESDVIGNFTGEVTRRGFCAGMWCPQKTCDATHSDFFNYVAPLSLRAYSKTNNQWHTMETEFVDNTMIFTVDGDTQSIARDAYWNSAQIVLMGGSASYRLATDKVKIRNIKIWHNGAMVRNYITCRRNSDNTYGVYDLINNTFTGTTNGTLLTGGPDITNNLYLPSGN